MRPKEVRLTPGPQATYSSLLRRNFEDFGAEVAELADALGSGSSARKGVGVQIPPSAPCVTPMGFGVGFPPRHFAFSPASTRAITEARVFRISASDARIPGSW